MTRTTWLAAIFGGLAVLAATQSCASPEAQTSEVGQEADGCGAWRYRGTANVDCRYQGSLSYGGNHSGTCLNDSQVECTFDARCQWSLSERITGCVSDAPDCMTTYPPEGSTSNPPPQTFNLPPGSNLCDPPATADQLRSFCANRFSDVYSQLRTYCSDQTDRNTGGTTCCLSCPTPAPLPGTSATATGDSIATISVCSAEDN